MIELHSFSSFEEISLASKFALIVIGILSTLVTVLFVLRYGMKSHYKMTNSDYAIAMILSFIACIIFPVIGNGGWNWFVITGVCAGMIFLKSIKHLT